MRVLIFMYYISYVFVGYGIYVYCLIFFWIKKNVFKWFVDIFFFVLRGFFLLFKIGKKILFFCDGSFLINDIKYFIVDIRLFLEKYISIS